MNSGIEKIKIENVLTFCKFMLVNFVSGYSWKVWEFAKAGIPAR
jgi:hypothetical protein